MLPAQPAITRKNIITLLRLVAVVFSSVATILSTVLPLLFYTDLSAGTVMTIASVLLIGAVCIHGMLTHTLNDIADYQSGTDQHSPGILSGGSGVLQNGAMSVGMLKQLGDMDDSFLIDNSGIVCFSWPYRICSINLDWDLGGSVLFIKAFSICLLSIRRGMAQFISNDADAWNCSTLDFTGADSHVGLAKWSY